MFKAILVRDKNSDPKIETKLQESELPPGDVLIKTEYTTINYKDSLAIVKKIPIIRDFPMIPGIDFAGSIIESSNPAFKIGQNVLSTGWGVGESHWGGFSELVRVNSEWLTKIPENLSQKSVMSIGTAGFTAMLAIAKLEEHGINQKSGKILVTGASGGVGSISVAILSNLGFEVIAMTGNSDNKSFLKSLGAKEIINRFSSEEEVKILDKQKWIGVIDTVGSTTLAKACSSTLSDGAVVACGNAQGLDFPTSVAPFILRGINLYGIDSVKKSQECRSKIWNRLSTDLPIEKLQKITNEYSFDEIISTAHALLNGNIKGRVVIKINP